MKLATHLRYAALAFATTLPAAAQSPQDADAVVAAFVEAFNLGDREVLTAYVQAHYSGEALAQRGIDARVDELLDLNQRLGVIAPTEISGVTRMLIVSARSSRQTGDADIVLLRDADEPSRIAEVWAHPVTDALRTAEARLP